MWQQQRKGQVSRPVIKAGVAVVISAAFPAGVVGASMTSAGTGDKPVPYSLSAAITDSNTTIGFADSDIIGESPADINKTLDEMQSLGVQNIRILIPWNNVEPVQGYWNWSTVDTLVNAAAARNMGILGVLNATPAWAVPAGDPAVATPPASDAQYAQFAGAVAQRYAGKVSAYEVWNEPNAAPSWYPTPDPAAYTKLLQAAYPAIKAADPKATVIGGVVGWVTDTPGLAINAATYVQDMYNSGAKGYFDALSFHPYQYQVPFGNGTPYGPVAPINQLATIHQEMVAAGDGSKDIWATEYGEPTSVVNNATQASFISNFVNSWSSVNYTGPMFIYTTRDRNTGSTSDQDTLGVFQTDWTPKPAATVIAQWTATHPQTAPADPPNTLASVAGAVTGTATDAATATKTAAAQTMSTAQATVIALAGMADTPGKTAPVTAPVTATATPSAATPSAASVTSAPTPVTAAKPSAAKTATSTAATPASASTQPADTAAKAPTAKLGPTKAAPNKAGSAKARPTQKSKK